MRKIVALLPCLFLATACGAPDAASPDPQPRVIETPTGGERMEVPAAPAPKASAFTVSGTVVTTLADGAHAATVELVVLDEAGRPAANVELQGSFTDGIKEGAVLTTDAAGVATATVTGGLQHMAVGFTVKGATELKDGSRVAGKVLTGLIYPSPCCPLKTPPIQ